MHALEPRPNKQDNTPLTLSVSETAKLLGVSRDLVYDLVARRELPALRLGRRIVLPRKAIEELVKGAADDGRDQATNESSSGIGSALQYPTARTTLQLAPRFPS